LYPRAPTRVAVKALPIRPRSETRAEPYTQRAGSRLFVPRSAPDDLAYSDGDEVEHRLLDLVRGASDVSLHSPEIAAAITDWPTRYHLSAGRAHLLRPLAHLLAGRTLEVGAGCGALTRYLGELGGEVVAVEGSRRRAEITAARCRDLRNVAVFHDRFERFETASRFSAVTLVGVLEWAARFGGDAHSARRLLAHAVSLLDEGGVVIVAIENQLGLKYLAGWAEDHLGVAMRGVSDAYDAGEPRTFGLGELTALVASAGLRHHAVFAPFPDYKLPRVIVSPEGLDHVPWRRDLAALVGATPVTDAQPPTLPLFSLERTLALAARNGLLKGLANSFLVVASRAAVPQRPEPHVLAWHYSGVRRLSSTTETRFLRSPHGIRVERHPVAPGDAAGAESEGRVHHRPGERAFQPGELWIERLGALINRPGWSVADLAEWAAPWRDTLATAAGLQRPAATSPVLRSLVDATPFNMVVTAEGEHRFFDLEWEPAWRVEYGFVLFRGLFWSLSRYRSVATPAAGVPLGILELTAQLADALGTALPPSELARYLDLEADFQHDTTGLGVRTTRLSLERQRLHARPSIEALAGLSAEVESLTARHVAAAAERDSLQADIERLGETNAHETLRQADAHRQALEQAATLREQAETEVRTLHERAAHLARALQAETAAHQQAREHAHAQRHALEQAARAHAALAQKGAAVNDRLAEAEAALDVAEAALAAAEATRQALASQLDDVQAAQASLTIRLTLAVGERHAAEAALVRERDAAEAVLVRERAAAEAALRQSHAREAQRTLEAGTLATAVRDAGARLADRQRALDRVRAEHERATGELLGRIASAGARPVVAVPRPTLVRRVRHFARRAPRAALGAARHPLQTSRSLVRRRRGWYRERVALLTSSALFDADYYRARVGLAPGVDLKARFLLAGDIAGESPHPLFDPEWYRARHADVGGSLPPLQHYLLSGGWERRSPHPLFDAAHYLDQWPAGAVTGATPLSHYVRTGGVSAASPHPLFDARHYFAQRPDLAHLGINPLLHYLSSGHAEGLDPHLLFSTRYYVEHTPDLEGRTPLEHFVRRGAAEGRSPHPLFDLTYYWQQRPDVRAAGENALVHYLRFGHREGVSPHPLFDTVGYRQQAEGLDALGVTGLEHYLRWGWQDGLRPNPWFDPRWYLEHNLDLMDLWHVEPLQHFLMHGWREGRDPSAAFSVSHYLERYPDVTELRMNPLEHFLRHGLAEGRLPDLPRPADWHGPGLRLQVSGRVALGPTVLCVTHVSPWPVGAGNEYRLARLLGHLRRQGYRIILVLSPLPGEPLAPGTLDRLAADYGNVVLCDRDGRVEYRFADHPDVLRHLAEDPAALAVPAEPGPDLAYCHDLLVAVVKKLADSIGPAAIIAEYIFMTRIFPFVGEGRLRIVDTHDVLSQKGSNVIAYGIDDAETPAAEEARLLNRANLVMAIHEADAEALRRIAPQRDVIVAGVDADVRTQALWSTRPVALLAASGNPLNVAGIRDFLRLAWPRVLAEVPEAELRVAGKLGRAVPAGTPGVTVLGYVPDLSTEYAVSRVVINPAVAGTGLKIKSIEALANLRPVVGWPHNRDGLPPALAAFVDEAADWQDFAEALIARLRQPTSPFGERIVERVVTALSPTAAYAELDRRLRHYFDAAGSLDPKR